MPGSGRSEGRSRGVTTYCWRRRRRSSSGSAVFVGGCRLEAAEAVCDFDGTFGDELLDGLDSLVQKSLLRQRAGLRRRAALLDARDDPRVRARAARVGRRAGGRVRAARRLDGRRRRAAGRRVADRRPPGLPRAGRRRATRTCARRSAFARKAHDGELLLRLATALWGFWSSRGLRRRGRRALEDALELSGRRPARDAARPLHAAHAQREQREACARPPRRRSRRARSWATTTASPRPGTSSAASREPDGLACDRRGRLEAGALVRAPRRTSGRRWRRASRG